MFGGHGLRRAGRDAQMCQTAESKGAGRPGSGRDADGDNSGGERPREPGREAGTHELDEGSQRVGTDVLGKHPAGAEPPQSARDGLSAAVEPPQSAKDGT